MKLPLIKKILSYLSEELNILLVAANNAHLAATDEQSIAETQYDTLAIEAGYLAEGQSRRVGELKLAITAFENLAEMLKQTSDRHQYIKLGSVVQLSQDQSANQYFFIAPAAAGFRCSISCDIGCDIKERNFTVITPQSPMGKALLNKSIEDEVAIKLGNSQLNDEIVYLE
ncbi:MAG: hypothetical protein P8I03_04865 [Thalassotalea sp.]|nr:hypothetical protein [Thalassotalea sp.]